MTDTHQVFDYDVFVSYRWAEPDQSWVRDELVPALQAAGLRVCLDVNDFVPGRDLILEMTRAGQSSRRALCILSDDYFAGNRMVHFEALNARRMDPSGLDSRLVPLVLRSTNLPEWVRGLIPVDWTDERGRASEWRKLLEVLGAPRNAIPPASVTRPASLGRSTPVFLHDYNLPQAFVARNSELLQLTCLLAESTGESAITRLVLVTAIGGVGKSCLCRELIERPEITATFSRVIWFSFYEARAEAEDYFLREVLTHGFRWGHQDKPLEGTKEHVRLRRALSEALDKERTLLVLDGMEVIQFTDDPASAAYGGIKPTWGEIDKLLRHVLNGPSSVCLITSRVPLRQLETIRGYRHVPLDLFMPKDGAHLLHSLGVEGKMHALEVCAENLGGHALSLVAAGRYMARRKVAADRLADLVDDPDVFRRTAEGEKVKRISEWYRSELSREQEYFLTRLSLQGRSVTAVNYPVLVLDYRGPTSDAEVEEHIIQPLVERGLVDRFQGGDKVIRLTAHPLMKLAFSTWLELDQRKRAHEEWARAAATAPGLFFRASDAASLEELQPFVDATEQYLAADNWREAWKVFADRGVGVRLGQLGYYELSLKFAKQFEEIHSRNSYWSPFESVGLFDLLAWLSSRLERQEETLAYRRKELVAARQGRIPSLSEVEALVASSLAVAGFVWEASNIDASDQKACGNVALAQGAYVQAAKFLRAALKEESGHGRTVAAQPLAEAIYRVNKFDEAAQVLDEGLQLAIDSGFTCCQGAILWRLIDLALRRGHVDQAQRWAEMRRELRRRLELDAEEHPWLLLAEGDFNGAFAAADGNATTSPSKVIERHVMRARIFLKQGHREDAAVELNTAEQERSTSGYGQLNNDIVALRQELRT
jgi:tetratricopeptide (TPR) repeat protein